MSWVVSLSLEDDPENPFQFNCRTQAEAETLLQDATTELTGFFEVREEDGSITRINRARITIAALFKQVNPSI